VYSQAFSIAVSGVFTGKKLGRIVQVVGKNTNNGVLAEVNDFIKHVEKKGPPNYFIPKFFFKNPYRFSNRFPGKTSVKTVGFTAKKWRTLKLGFLLSAPEPVQGQS